jgi:hypothetical protein
MGVNSFVSYGRFEGEFLPETPAKRKSPIIQSAGRNPMAALL